MSAFRRRFAAALLMAVGLALASSPGAASVFFGWQATGVPRGDLLNIRAYPSPASRVLVGYPNGARLSLTGRCTGGLHLDQIAGQPSERQRRAVRARWCQVWLDPTSSGAFRSGWVSGHFIRPL